MGEIIGFIVYGILSVPVFLAVLWWIYTLLFSPFIVVNNVLNEFSKSVVKETKSLQTTEKLEYDPKYSIEDPLNFADLDISDLQVGDVVFIED
tara:strand:- start:1310 stop:1588 length:279 start_codon:yes stop_codon:yes gene_type:complete